MGDPCTPGTHFYTAGRCTYCNQAPTPVLPRPRCQRCAGTGIQSLTWTGIPGDARSKWRMDDCQTCDGTGCPEQAAS